MEKSKTIHRFFKTNEGMPSLGEPNLSDGVIAEFFIQGNSGGIGGVGVEADAAVSMAASEGFGEVH